MEEKIKNKTIRRLILENLVERLETGKINELQFIYLVMQCMKNKLHRIARFYEKNN